MNNPSMLGSVHMQIHSHLQTRRFGQRLASSTRALLTNMTTIHALRGLMSRPLFTRSFAFVFCVAALLAGAPGGVNAAVITVDTANAANWKQSTFSYIDDTDPNWPGVTTPLPNAATYTVDTANQALAAGFTGIFAGSGVTFYRSVFSLPSFSTLTADLSALVDNNIEIFVNGISLARYVTDLNGFLSGDFRLFIGTSGAVNNGYLGGRPFSFVQTPFPQSAWVSGGNNEVVVAVRNLGDGDTGGFRLSLALTTAIQKTTPVITWANPAPIVFGTALGAAQLNATANVPGTFTFSPAAGTVLGAGTYTLTANFTPTDTSLYNNASAQVTLMVQKATATVTLGNLAQTFDGIPKNATATTAPAGLAVNITYDGSATAPTAAGSYAVVGTVSDANYTGSASGTLTITATSTSPPVVIGPGGSIGGSGPVTLDGGTLQASASATVTSPIILGPAGAKLNTLFHFLRLQGAISGSGRLTKFGSGILALEANNTYSGGTRINAGIFQILRNANLGAFAGPVTLNKAQLRIRTQPPQTRQTIQLDRKLRVTAQGGKVSSYGGRSTTQITKSIRGTGTVRKAGKGTLRLSGNQKYVGKTAVKKGTLQVNKPSKISKSPITITQQRQRDLARDAQLKQQLAALSKMPKTPERQKKITALLLQRESIKGRLKGTGQVKSAKFKKNSALAPGNSPGSMSVVEGVELEGGSIIEWEINNAAGAKGAFGGGWDWVDIGGTLDISASAADPVVLDIRSLLVEAGAVEEVDPVLEEEPVDPEADLLELEAPIDDPMEDEEEEPEDAEEEEDDEAVPYGELLNFDPRQNYRWVIATAQGGINGFSPDKFQLDLTAFQNELEGGSFSVEADANNVYLVFTRFNHPPLAQCKNVTVFAGADCSASASINDGSSDPDDGDTITVTQTPAGPYPVGVTTVTLTVTDNHGASASCSSTVTVIDNTPPTLTVPNPIVVGNDAGNCGAVINFTVTAADNCPGVTEVSTPASGSTFPKGTTTVTSVATDAAGNTTTKTFTVTVNDTEPPSLTVPTPIVVSNTPGSCDAGVTFAVTATDNCPGVTVVSTPVSGSTFPKGMTTVTSVATDAAGNTTTKTFTVTVKDVEAPKIVTAASNQTVECDGAGNTAALNAWLASNGGAVATDNCGGVTWSHNFTALSDGCGATGSATVTFTATDSSGNSIVMTATFTIVDTTAPVLTSNVRDILPKEKPITFTVTSQDLCCSAVTINLSVRSYAINGAGKEIDKSGSTVLKITGNQVTIVDSGGVGTIIEISATGTDDCGNKTITKFAVKVLRPANEGVGNGVDGNTPGDAKNGGNDSPGSTPGNPGAKNKK